MRHILVILALSLLNSCQVLTAATSVIGGSIACGVAEENQDFPEKGARKSIELSFQIKDRLQQGNQSDKKQLADLLRRQS